MSTAQTSTNAPGRTIRLRDRPTTFWLLLSLPGIAMLAFALGGEGLASLLHPSGEVSARLLVVALLLTPLRELFPKVRWLRWLMRRRRHLGVAAFGYAALHTLAYLIDAGSLSTAAAEALEPALWTGWLAFVVFVPLALTSNDASVKGLGRRWKTLQRLVHLAAAATLAHWLLVAHGPEAALAHFVPLAALQAWRLRRRHAERAGPAVP